MLSFDELKSLPSSVNNSFRGIPFSREDKIHERVPESLLSGRRTKGNLLAISLVFAGFRKGLSIENLLFRREGMAD